MDMASKNQDIIRCEVVIFVGDHNEYILSVQMILPRAQLKRIDTLMVQYMNKILEMPEQGKTVFSS